MLSAGTRVRVASAARSALSRRGFSASQQQQQQQQYSRWGKPPTAAETAAVVGLSAALAFGLTQLLPSSEPAAAEAHNLRSACAIGKTPQCCSALKYDFRKRCASTAEKLDEVHALVKTLDAKFAMLANEVGAARVAAGPKAGAAKGARVDVVLGAQWGDEGKGKLVDILAQTYDVCARVAGGSNAGNGVVVHIPTLLEEMKDLKEAGIDFEGRLKLSDRAHIVFDFHQQIDGPVLMLLLHLVLRVSLLATAIVAVSCISSTPNTHRRLCANSYNYQHKDATAASLNEGHLGRNKIGTTKKGIGPAYSSKILRNGIRIGDLQDFDEFVTKLTSLAEYYRRSYGDTVQIDLDAEIKYYKEVRDVILDMTVDTIEYVNAAFDDGKRILIEGANATMLDIDFGTYPYVTSSNPSVGSASLSVAEALHHHIRAGTDCIAHSHSRQLDAAALSSAILNASFYAKMVASGAQQLVGLGGVAG
eukprot:6339-Heterococcus_DN1.PRE.4